MRLEQLCSFKFQHLDWSGKGSHAMKKLRILIIDSEPRWIDFAKNELSPFEIVVAPDTKTALAELEDDQFDLVIASSRRLDALEIIAREYSDKLFIVTTVHPTTQEALAAYRLGAMRYFPKSFRQQDLLNHVSEVIPASVNAQ
ncbi:MAG TPA: response regulator [Chloroflexi bacterium]|nr:response regulator [Chloroflexota bacterium]